MENSLDVITKKLYDEGIAKANHEADTLVSEAKGKAEKIIAEAKAQANSIVEKAEQSAIDIKRKAESDMSLSARQAVTALKQEVTEMISGKVSTEMAHAAYDDKNFVQELMTSIVKKWDVASGNLDLNVILDDKSKADFEKYISSKYSDLLNKGLGIKAGGTDGEFTIEPKDGGFRIAFSEEMFKGFFNQYMRGLTKELLYKE